MARWWLGCIVSGALANAIAVLFLLIAGFVFGFAGGVAAMQVFDLTGRQGGRVVSVLWLVPTILFVVVGVAGWIDARVQALRLHGTSLQAVGHDPAAAVLDPLVAEVAGAGFIEVARVRRTRAPMVLLVSADGILAVVSPLFGAGIRRARRAADGTPASITLLNPMVVGTETAHLVTAHASLHLRRWTLGPIVGQLVPDGDARAMVARHRATAAHVTNRGLAVRPVGRDTAIAEVERFSVQQRTAVVPTVAWLTSLRRRGHEGVSGAIDARKVDQQLQQVLGLLPFAQQRTATARIKAAAGVVPPPPAGLPAALPDGPPTSWPGGAWG